jgi:hypothetical protein
VLAKSISPRIARQARQSGHERNAITRPTTPADMVESSSLEGAPWSEPADRWSVLCF